MCIYIYIYIEKYSSLYNLPWRPWRGTEMQLYSFFNLGTWWGGWSTPRPGRFTPRKQTLFPLDRKLGGPQSRSGRVRKISSPPGFDPRTVHIYVYITVHQSKARVLRVLLWALLKPQIVNYPQPTRIQYKCLPCVCTCCSTDLNLPLLTSTIFPACSSYLHSKDSWRPRNSPTTLSCPFK